MIKNKNEIMIFEVINSNLGMRSSATEFFNELNTISEKNLFINFDNVKYISRSFAQEYIQQKKRTNKIINEKNVPEGVKRMFEVVKNSSKPKSVVLASI